jgi:hypothetical protein
MLVKILVKCQPSPDSMSGCRPSSAHRLAWQPITPTSLYLRADGVRDLQLVYSWVRARLAQTDPPLAVATRQTQCSLKRSAGRRYSLINYINSSTMRLRAGRPPPHCSLDLHRSHGSLQQPHDSLQPSDTARQRVCVRARACKGPAHAPAPRPARRHRRRRRAVARVPRRRRGARLPAAGIARTVIE